MVAPGRLAGRHESALRYFARIPSDPCAGPAVVMPKLGTDAERPARLDPTTKQGRMQIGVDPQQVTLTQAHPDGQPADDEQVGNPAQDCGRWQKPRPSMVWKQTQPGSWQLGSAPQVPPGHVGQGCVPQQSQPACCADVNASPPALLTAW
jgi:hypothetical protein